MKLRVLFNILLFVAVIFSDVFASEQIELSNTNIVIWGAALGTIFVVLIYSIFYFFNTLEKIYIFLLINILFNSIYLIFSCPLLSFLHIDYFSNNISLMNTFRELYYLLTLCFIYIFIYIEDRLDKINKRFTLLMVATAVLVSISILEGPTGAKIAIFKNIAVLLAFVFLVILMIYQYFVLNKVRFRYMILGLLPYIMYEIYVNWSIHFGDTYSASRGSTYAGFSAYFSFFTLVALTHRTEILRKKVRLSHEVRGQELKRLVKKKTRYILEGKGKLQESNQIVMLGEIVRGVLFEIKPYIESISKSLLSIQKYRLDTPELSSNNKLENPISQVCDSVERINHLKNSFLLLSSNENEKEDFRSKFVPVDLKNILEIVLLEFNDKLKDIMTTVEVDKNIEMIISGDREKIKFVIENILNNAIESINKSDESESQAWINFKLEVESENVIAIQLLDSGPGLSAQQLEEVCEPFYTNHQVTSHIGLGLFNVKNIMLLHQGDVVFEDVNGGKTFFPKLVFVHDVD